LYHFGWGVPTPEVRSLLTYTHLSHSALCGGLLAMASFHSPACSPRPKVRRERCDCTLRAFLQGPDCLAFSSFNARRRGKRRKHLSSSVEGSMRESTVPTGRRSWDVAQLLFVFFSREEQDPVVVCLVPWVALKVDGLRAEG
jgi:hypothetical protein